MALMAEKKVITEVGIAVLREMVRLSEARRSEALDAIEKVNKYNLALIAFSGSFLSLIVTSDIDQEIVRIAGAFLVASIVISLITIRPMKIKGGILVIDKDVDEIRKTGETFPLEQYLLDIADLTSRAAIAIDKVTSVKKSGTICSAFLLAFALLSTYIYHGYAAPW